MNNDPSLQDLRLFCIVARRASFVAAAREAAASQALISKRIALLEQSLGVKLLHRTTRKVSPTEEGLRVFEWAQRILGNVEDMREDIARDEQDLKGPIRISSSARLGREMLAPALSKLKLRYPGVDIWLELLDRRVDLVGEGFHLDIRAGEATEPSLYAHKIASSFRILCAAPSYVAQHGMPTTPAELVNHNCLLLRERNEPFGTWRLQGPRGVENTKVSGSLASNDIDILLQWAHDGHGILMSADWLFAPSLSHGHLVRLLPEWQQPANIIAVSSARSAHSAKVRICIEYLKHQFTTIKA